MFTYHHNDTPFKRLELEAPQPCIERIGDHEILSVDAQLLQLLTTLAFYEISHFLRPKHLQQLASILADEHASENDKFVAFDLLKNANIAAGGILPMCQDTGTAIITAYKGEKVFVDGDDTAALESGISAAYAQHNLRFSQMAPLSMYEEQNTGNNLPAQIDIFSTKGNSYKFLFIAKGGGSANKSFLYQQTRAILNETSLLAFLEEKMKTIGTSACPPYHLAVVIGGTSAELALKTVKLASCHYLDNLPTSGDAAGRVFRDAKLEQQVYEISKKIGIGAQFGGTYFCHDVRVVRLPRHGASLPIAIGVSCSADRQALAYIDEDGVFFEQLEHEPARYMPEIAVTGLQNKAPIINLDDGMEQTLKQLRPHPVATQVLLSGTLIVARDIAHEKLKQAIVEGRGLPEYFKQSPVYYAGPAKTPVGKPSGSFGPTTAGRMDTYVDIMQEYGGSMVMLAKGNRSNQVTAACKKHGGFYLGTIGGTAAHVAESYIKRIEVLDFPELNMEAVWKIQVEKFPAFIIVDDKGNDFFASYNIPAD